MSDSSGHPGWMTPNSFLSDYSSQRFMIEQILGEVSTATLVKVTKVSNSGEVKAVGTVSVTPMVNMTDGQGNAQKHIPINNLPYWRLQGGDKAVIMDPKVGDIGIMVTADRDTSSVRKTKKQSNPGSYRRFDMADGMFIPCMLGDKPTSYIQFQDDGTIVASPDDGATIGMIKKDKVQIKVGNMKLTVTKTRVDLNCDAGEGTQRVMCESGPISNVWCIP